MSDKMYTCVIRHATDGEMMSILLPESSAVPGAKVTLGVKGIEGHGEIWEVVKVYYALIKTELPGGEQLTENEIK